MRRSIGKMSNVLHVFVNCVTLFCSIILLIDETEQTYTKGNYTAPLFIQQPDKIIYYVINEPLTIPCEAQGMPNPRYSWFKNGQQLSLTTNSSARMSTSTRGSLVFTDIQSIDEGYYQCTAQNSAGTAVSIILDLKKAVLDNFSPSETRRVWKQSGEGLVLYCTIPASRPKPRVYWVQQSSRNETITPVLTSDRITQNEEGSLTIGNIINSDLDNGDEFLCLVENEILKKIVNGSRHHISITPGPLLSHAVTIAFAPPTHQIALKGQTWRAQCSFLGNPTVIVVWVAPNSLDIDRKDRARYENYGQGLVIDDVQFEDAGTYECMGINDGTPVPVRRNVNLIVEAAPYWTNDASQNINGREGDSAMFNCNASGSPNVTYEWRINGQPIKDALQKDRVDIEEGILIMNDLKWNDGCVVQCNISNKHGYIHRNMYLNMPYIPLQIMTPKSELTVTENGKVEIPCDVQGYPRPEVTWYKGNRTWIYGNQTEDLITDNPATDDPITVVSNTTDPNPTKFTTAKPDTINNERIIVTKEGHLEINFIYLGSSGEYTCVAENEYERVESSTSVIVNSLSTNSAPALKIFNLLPHIITSFSVIQLYFL